MNLSYDGELACKRKTDHTINQFKKKGSGYCFTLSLHNQNKGKKKKNSTWKLKWALRISIKKILEVNLNCVILVFHIIVEIFSLSQTY